MFRLSLSGRITAVDWTEDGARVTLAVPHDRGGAKSPIWAEVDVPMRLLPRDPLPVGEQFWADGDGRQERELGLLDDEGAWRPAEDGELVSEVEGVPAPVLRLTADMISVGPDALPRGRSAIWATVHARLSSDTVLSRAASGPRVGEMVVKGTAHVHQRGGVAVFRFKRWGDDAEHLGKLAEGERINLEGPVYERRWDDADGVARRAHEIVVRRWTYAQDPPRSARRSTATTHGDVIWRGRTSEMLTSRHDS